MEAIGQANVTGGVTLSPDAELYRVYRFYDTYKKSEKGLWGAYIVAGSRRRGQ